MVNLLQLKKHGLITFTLLSLFIGTSSVANNALPDLGSPDLVIYDSLTEQRLGEAFKATLHRDFKISKDLVLNQYIRDLGHQLASHAETARPFRFYVIENPTINAFAGPNGIIGIHTGLIKATQSEAELAAVIAHEISHVTQNHLSRRFEYASSAGNVNSIATILAAILIGSIDPNAGMATLMGGMGYNLQQQLRNSRIHETEADSIGINLLYKAGFDAHAMGDFFKRLSKNESLNTFKLPEILRTHPVSDNRLAEAENRAAQLKQVTIKDDSENFRLIKLSLLKSHAEQLLAQPKFNRNEECFIKVEQTKKMQTCLLNIISNKPKSLIYLNQALTTYITQTSKNNQQAKLISKQANLYTDLFPKNADLLVNYSLFLAKNEGNETAINFLQSRIARLDYQYQANKTLSELYAEDNQLGYAYFYLAKYYLETGHAKRAKYYLEQAEEQMQNSDKTLKHKIENYRQTNNKLLILQDKN